MPLENALELRSVTSLLVDEFGSPVQYRVPAYQRGFRWTNRQVTQLLDDIWDFIQTDNEKTAFYCLQPLVVQKSGDGCYDIVDGQQRLTTIFILLDQLKDLVALLNKQPFAIDYETRDSTFLSNIDLNRADENVDFYHICKAWRAIKEWRQKRDSSHALKLLQHLLNDDEAGENVKFIWYELAPGDDSIAVFTRLNVGKIPLTEAELVRALFLRRAAQDDSTGNLSLRIAYEWDQIEKRLQYDAIWYFLQNKGTENSNRIGIIFQLVAQMAGQKVKNEDYVAFFHFAELLNQEKTAEAQWRKVKQIYMALEEWYEDRYLFHILGFILHQAGDSFATITELLDNSRTSGKKEFTQQLRRRVCRLVLDKELETISPEELREEITDLCQTVGYGNRNMVRRLLLLFNLATLLEDSRSNIRFQFDSFKRETWDIEHIRSVSDKRPSRDYEQKEWLQHCLKFLRNAGDANSHKLVSWITTFLDNDTEPKDCIAFEEIDGEILSYFNEATDAPEYELANLTLLDSRTNRGYRNAVFAIKRGILLERDRSGIFVPLCTRNVFLKCYSRAVGNAIFWTKEDACDYLNAMSETLIRFFLGQGVEE